MNGSSHHFDAVADAYRSLPRDVPAEYTALLMRHLRTGSGTRFLELGCGMGEIAIAIASTGARVVGLDASIEMLLTAQRTAGASRVTWVNQPVEDFDFGTRSFDVVFSYESFHLFQDPTALVERIGRAIAPAARFAVGWRTASWEDEFKAHMVSTFETFGVSLTDWGYSTCHGFDEWVAATNLFDRTLEAEVQLPSRDRVNHAATFLASIDRTSHLGNADRHRLRQSLQRGLASGAVDGELIGTTAYGIKMATRTTADYAEGAG